MNIKKILALCFLPAAIVISLITACQNEKSSSDSLTSQNKGQEFTSYADINTTTSSKKEKSESNVISINRDDVTSSQDKISKWLNEIGF